MSNVIHIPASGGSPLVQELARRFAMKRWRRENIAARPTDDPDTWDHATIARLEAEHDLL